MRVPRQNLRLAARDGHHGARCVGQVELAGALVTEPDEDVWSVGPKKRTDLSRGLHRVIRAQTLQRANVKDAVVKLALGAVVTMNTHPFTKHLFGHDESPRFLRPVKRRNNKFVSSRVSGIIITCERSIEAVVTISRTAAAAFEYFVDV